MHSFGHSFIFFLLLIVGLKVGAGHLVINFATGDKLLEHP